MPQSTTTDIVLFTYSFPFLPPLSFKKLPLKKNVLSVGAGPTSLGAATRLHQHGKTDWLLINQAAEPEGLACTDVTPEGSLFDMGGHALSSRIIGTVTR